MSTQAAAATTAIPTGMVTCRACGSSLHRTAPICPGCGASQRSRGYKSKMAAGVLAIFLGGLGVHRFYLGQWWGIFYLLLFWTMVPGLVALVEGVVFLASSQESWDQRHNEGKPNVGGEGSAGLVVALVVGVFAFIMVLGILAAVAIPAYHDYTLRAKVALAMPAAEQARAAVEQYIIDNRAFPGSNAEAGVAEQAGAEHAVRVEEGGVIVMTFTGQSVALENQTIVFTPVIQNDTLYWDCSGGTLKAKFRPPECR